MTNLMSVLRYVSVLHATWLVNSAAHMFGMKPYDVKIGPVENMAVTVLAIGEGFHNYHHTFPYDYSTSEWGPHLNITTASSVLSRCEASPCLNSGTCMENALSSRCDCKPGNSKTNNSKNWP